MDVKEKRKKRKKSGCEGGQRVETLMFRDVYTDFVFID